MTDDTMQETRMRFLFLCRIAAWTRHGKKNDPFDRPCNTEQGKGAQKWSRK